MRSAFLRLLVALSSACLGCSATAQGLFGHEVTLTIERPLGTVLSVPATRVVGPIVEFAVGTVEPLPGFTLSSAVRDVGESFIDTVYLAATTFGGTFNAAHFRFDNASPVILGASLDPSSTIAPAITFGDHDVYINVAGLSAVAGSHSRVNLTFAAPVPEPETYAMLVGGLIFVRLFSTRRRSSAAST